MQRSVLYARVSSDNQKKERTIDSQILELKKQIAAAGDSGARLDRPALDQLRKDLKCISFDLI
jgi:DNA invertase Pin-like site-specific DNA recombinase